MDSPGRHVLFLARKIGVREAGSDGEAAAASYVKRSMNESGVGAEEEVFSCWRSDQPALALICLACVGAYLLFRLSYLSCLLLGFATFLCFQMETYSWAVVSKLFPRSRAANVVGRVDPEGETRHRVVLVANYDTGRTSPLGRPVLARTYRFIYILVFVSVLMVAALGFIGFFGSLAKIHRHTLFVIWICFAPFAIILSAFCGLLLWGEVFGTSSPGANDNASGVGVMLSAIDYVADEPLEFTEVWGVATARGFAGGRGVVSLLRRHRALLRGADFISIDHAGRGDIAFMRREGPLLGYAPSRGLRRTVVRAAGKTPGVNIRKGRCRVKKGDAVAARARGRKAITVGGVSGGSYPGWRRSDDVYHNVDTDTLEKTARLVRSVLEEIDRSQRGSRKRESPSPASLSGRADSPAGNSEDPDQVD